MREIWRHRRLLRELVRRDLRTRYKVSVLGFFWSLLRPLMSMAIIAVVFTHIAPLSHDSFPHVSYFSFLLCAYLPWSFLTAGLLEGTQAILGNASLIKKVACPRSIFPTAIVLSHLINTVLAFAVLLPLIYLFSSAEVSFSVLWLIPLLLGETLLILGLVWGLSALNVLYRDVTQILEFVTLAWFYATPIIYSINLPLDKLVDKLEIWGLPSWLSWLYMLNPMTMVVYASRYVCLGLPEKAEWVMPGSALAVGFVVFIVCAIGSPFVGQALFRRLETRAVDSL